MSSIQEQSEVTELMEVEMDNDPSTTSSSWTAEEHMSVDAYILFLLSTSNVTPLQLSVQSRQSTYTGNSQIGKQQPALPSWLRQVQQQPAQSALLPGEPLDRCFWRRMHPCFRGRAFKPIRP
mmetsp:Transcript_57846/g.126758  ORF Transcript_57846/g.126758 Transcript_57846/m.126758 type:complete len:122 (-) Transcript_57846:1283-1648(-)